MNHNFNSFNDAMSPITQVAEQFGIRDPVQDWGMNTIHGIAPGMGESKIQWQPRHREVFKQMDDAQWAELRALPHGAQNAWLDTRMNELSNHSAHQAFNKTGQAFYGMFDDIAPGKKAQLAAEQAARDRKNPKPK